MIDDQLPLMRGRLCKKYRMLSQHIDDLEVPIDLTQDYPVSTVSSDFRLESLHADKKVEVVLK